MATEAKSAIELCVQAVQVVSVVTGVVISILSFNSAREKEFETRKAEAAKPFLELRQKLYGEALKSVAVLANPETHSPDEIAAARKRFRELYVAELSMVESKEVEAKMVELAKGVDPQITSFTPAQQAAYNLAHALGDSFAAAWGVPNDARRRVPASAKE